MAEDVHPPNQHNKCLCCANQQGSWHGRNRPLPHKGEVKRGERLRNLDEPHAPIVFGHRQPTPPAQPPQGYPAAGGWAGGVGRQGSCKFEPHAPIVFGHRAPFPPHQIVRKPSRSGIDNSSIVELWKKN